MFKKLALLTILFISLFLFSGCGKKWKCVDVTSIDYNRDNDMKCTRLDGSRFYTDYAGAKEFEENNR